MYSSKQDEGGWGKVEEVVGGLGIASRFGNEKEA
jgi:hypothetical protein